MWGKFTCCNCLLESSLCLEFISSITVPGLSWGQLSLTVPQTLWIGGASKHKRRRQRHPNPVLLPGKSHRWKSLVGCSPWGREESDTTERLHFHFSLSCIGEGNATHASVLAWRIPGTSMGSHDWSDLAAAAVSTKDWVVVTGNVHKEAALFHAQVWFHLRPEP